eukprot:TRINITY_DN3226_c0_g2_i1.p1 TRINITY_DN3226_c0_g2~~TRINITY_DN3226_c0_g2_i1.p1  ORF type:complete len:296 (-),score=-15.35 TRINITY_DN3226_c0_g2_i1:121-1008(-)
MHLDGHMMDGSLLEDYPSPMDTSGYPDVKPIHLSQPMHGAHLPPHMRHHVRRRSNTMPDYLMNPFAMDHSGPAPAPHPHSMPGPMDSGKPSYPPPTHHWAPSSPVIQRPMGPITPPAPPPVSAPPPVMTRPRGLSAPVQPISIATDPEWANRGRRHATMESPPRSRSPSPPSSPRSEGDSPMDTSEGASDGGKKRKAIKKTKRRKQVSVGIPQHQRKELVRLMELFGQESVQWRSTPTGSGNHQGKGDDQYYPSSKGIVHVLLQVPNLLSEIERLKKELAGARSELSDYKKKHGE